MAGDGEGSRARARAVHRGLQLRRRRAQGRDGRGDGGARRGPGAVCPYEYRRALLNACRESGVALEAHSPLGHGSHLSSETAARIGKRLNRPPAQVLLRWCTQHGIPFIAKSTHRERLAENAGVFDFTLSDQDMAELEGLDRTGGTDLALQNKWW